MDRKMARITFSIIIIADCNNIGATARFKHYIEIWFEMVDKVMDFEDGN